MVCKWQVEIDPYATRVLEKHWPNVPKFTDIKHIQVDKVANLMYDDRDGWTRDKLSRCRKSLQSGDVYRGCSELLSSESSINVAMAETAERGVSSEASLRRNESFSQRNQSERLRSKRTREGDSERHSDPQDPLRTMRGSPNVQEWADGNSSASSRLQQASGSNMVVPAMPSPMAQREQSDFTTRGINGKPFADSRIDLLCGGFP